MLRDDYAIPDGGSLGLVLSNSSYNSKVLKRCNPARATLIRHANRDNLVSFFDYDGSHMANLLIPDAPFLTSHNTYQKAEQSRIRLNTRASSSSS